MLASTGRDCIELQQREQTLASGREKKKPQRRINRRVTIATMRGKSSSLLLWQTTAPLTGLAYVLQRLQRFRATMAGRGPTPHSPDRWRVGPIAVAPPS